MALPASLLSEDQFTCSICLEVFTNPVSTPCGHSFCQDCIFAYWEGVVAGGSRPCQCPLCKESFRKRPELQINRTLKEITERFKEIAQGGRAEDGAGAEGAEDANTHPHHPHHTSRRGEMSESLIAEIRSRFQQIPTQATPPQADADAPHSPGQANAHLAHRAQSVDQDDPPPPYSFHRRHTVSGTSEDLSTLNLCPLHMRALDLFCRSDNTCVCSVCVDTAEHRGHTVIPVKREWHIKRAQLGIQEVELKDLICERERKAEEIKNSLRDIQAAAERETAETVCAFTKLMASVERCQAEVLEVMALSQRAAEHKAHNLLRELEEEISKLKRRSSALTQLVLSEDYMDFLKTFSSLSSPPQTKDWSRVSVSSELSSGPSGALKTVGPTLEQLVDELRKLPELCQSSGQRPRSEESVPRSNPKIRRVQEYADDIIFDHYTAHPRLIISADAKQVHCGDRHQQLPDNPERFDRVVCVLARQGFSSGRHYWEVEVGGKTDWDLGIASRSVNRKGKITVSPAHGYWFLSLRDRTDFAFRTEPSTGLMVKFKPSRIGIYVDCDKGLVSFYNVDARVLIYTFTDTFPDTVHPFFSPCTNKSGRNEAPLIICPVSTIE